MRRRRPPKCGTCFAVSWRLVPLEWSRRAVAIGAFGQINIDGALGISLTFGSRSGRELLLVRPTFITVQLFIA